MTLTQVIKAMDNQVSVLGGVDSAINACDRMYSARFRTQAFPLSSEDLVNNKHSLMAELARYVYTQAGFPFTVEDITTSNYTFIDSDYYEEEERDCGAEDYYYECAEDYLNNNFPDLTIDENTLVVELCNYKGEGEGLALACLCENLPIFKSKNESFYQVNR